MIRLSTIRRNPSIGVFAGACETVAFAAASAPESFIVDLGEALDVPVFQTDVAETSLVGSMIAFNSAGVALPRNITSRELEFFKGLDLNVAVIDDKHTALGNLILANDSGAVVSTHFSSDARQEISDVLDVDVEAMDLHGFRTVGSIGVATSKGALVHAGLSEEELESIEKLLKVDCDIGTVNRGVGYIRTGLIANSRGALIGRTTTSPEISRIEDALELL
ncbi:translation initiation factor IF-6 [archaeon BMS3Bbin16]|nr:translation initiation factor IF-6 [archaeon BMS3Bbin16]